MFGTLWIDQPVPEEHVHVGALVYCHSAAGCDEISTVAFNAEGVFSSLNTRQNKGCNPKHINLRVNSIEYNGSYF